MTDERFEIHEGPYPYPETTHICPVQGFDGTVTWRQLIQLDQAEWPDGHPCRDCNRLYKDHTGGPDNQCEGWR